MPRRLNEEDHTMFDQTILDEIRTRETARIDKVMRQTAPSTVLARLERADAGYIAYVSGCSRDILIPGSRAWWQSIL
jgi:hypothetical protein